MSPDFRSDDPAKPEETVPAGALPPWNVGDLPAPPPRGWKTLLMLLGPGVMLAGASVGTGEWLFGPAVTAQYGVTLLWLATIAISGQVFVNLEVMRYTLYCGEPVVVGYFRTWPGPRFWIVCYALLDLAAIWPYNAANAAVPLAAAFLGHLPSKDAYLEIGEYAMNETYVVRFLGFVIFLGAFVPLIFGGAVYRTLERIMAAKLVIVLGYLAIVCGLMVSNANKARVAKGFVEFGTYPDRAETIIDGPNFAISRIKKEKDGDVLLTVRGIDHGQNGREFMKFTIKRPGKKPDEFNTTKRPTIEPEYQTILDDMLTGQKSDERIAEARAHGFYLEDFDLEGDSEPLILLGGIDVHGDWRLADDGDEIIRSTIPDVKMIWSEIPPEKLDRARILIENRGLVPENLIEYVRAHDGKPPDLDWAMIAGFVAIAGAGGLTNALFSNYARDKGWGMGAHVGAIPSAVGGRNISLSHVGRAMRITPENRTRWKGWFRHILKDQFMVWFFCSVIGMALPCMISMQFIRNVPVEGDRVAATSAVAMAEANPGLAGPLMYMTLLCGFLILAPGQISAGDQIARRWTDIIWTSNRRAQKMDPHKVKYIYYGILAIYGVWGFGTLCYSSDPLAVAKLGTFFQNIGLGVTAFHTLYLNRVLLPKELRPNWFMQLGLAACGVFSLGIVVALLIYTWS